MKFYHLILAFCLSWFSSSAFAADGSSGCGPAWYVLKDNSLLSSFGRLVTNGFLSPVVTLGMTLGTSNCAKHKIVENDAKSLQFASENFEILRQDLARGEGSHLTSFIATFGCADAAAARLAKQLRGRFTERLYDSVEPTAYVIQARELIMGSDDLQHMCS